MRATLPAKPLLPSPSPRAEGRLKLGIPEIRRLGANKEYRGTFPLSALGRSRARPFGLTASREVMSFLRKGGSVGKRQDGYPPIPFPKLAGLKLFGQ